MDIDSKYTRILSSDDLTRQKYDELRAFAVIARDLRNRVSAHVNSNLLRYLEYTKHTFLKEMRALFINEVPSSFDAQLFTEVLTCYQNKFAAVRRNLGFESVTYKGIDLYKRATKKHAKGDFKKVVNDRRDTPLSICLTYLARYGNSGTLEYIAKAMETCDDKQREYYGSILRCCGKFGFERLMRLATAKRNRIIGKYAEHPVVFNSLTFSGRSRKKTIVDYNKRYGSVVNAFVSLSGLGRKSFDIPVKYSKDWHGAMRDYAKKTNDYEYTLTFDERHHQVRIHLCRDGKRHIPDAGDNLMGIDVNCKHNLFSLSDGSTYDYNRKLVNDYCKLAMHVDNLKKNKTYEVGRRVQRKLDIMRDKMRKSEQQLITGMCKALKSQGINHIVMEDLDNGFGRSHAKDKDNDDINYNRKVSFLRLSSLKDEVRHIAANYDIALSIVHASYTSKMCPMCGCIEDENRPDQETFCCVECGHHTNADHNAAVNIKNRVSEAVLRNKLLKQLDNGAYEPRKLKRSKVKDVLLSFRSTLPRAGMLLSGSV